MSSTTDSASTLAEFAALPQLLPATLGRFLSDMDVAACLCTCKALRTSLALHDAFWRYICHRTYRPPAYRAPKIDGLQRFPSWRDYWLDRPRVRTTGFYAVKIGYIPSQRILPPGHREVGSNVPARQVGEVSLVILALSIMLPLSFHIGHPSNKRRDCVKSFLLILHYAI